VRQRFGVGKIVYRNKVNIFVLISGPENKPPDSSKTVNGNLH
jgi:hypothetical protein